MRHAVSGLAATAMTLALTATASAQSSTITYYQQVQGSYQPSPIQPAATSTYQAPTTAQPTVGSTLYPSNNSYVPQASTTYAPSTTPYAPQQIGSTYATAPALGSTMPQPSTGYTASTPSYSSTTPSYGSPYTPTTPSAYAPTPPQQTYVAPTYGSEPTVYQNPVQQSPVQQSPVQQSYGSSTISSQPLAAPPSVAGYQPSVPSYAQPLPASTASATTDAQLQDSDAWSYNLARYYPAVQACLRKSSTKNPVIANIQQQGNQTIMLIGEGGSSNYSTCSTGLTGTTVKANSDIRNLPPAFFAPLGSTFTVSPERPFQPIVDTDQKVIGWLVRTQPSNAVNQFGQSAGFDGQFIPPMMVNTSVGNS